VAAAPLQALLHRLGRCLRLNETPTCGSYMWVLHVGGGEREGTVITNIDKVGVFRYFSVHINAGKGDMACHVCKNDKCVASRID
jgi:hypothetical protein